MPYEHLFAPYSAPGLELPHRIALAPLTRNRAVGTVPAEINAEYYAQRATAAITISEGSSPAAVGHGYLDIAGVHTDAQQAGWKHVADRVHDAGGRLWVQLMHCGRVAHPHYTDGVTPVAPSPVLADGEVWTPEGMVPFVEPRELETAELEGVKHDYVQAAERVVAAGGDGVELHAANGYLLHQFLGTNTNLRTDGYGSDAAGRVRFVLEVARATADAIGTERVGIRISPEHPFNDMQDAGWEETYDLLIAGLGEIGLAYLHVLEPAPDDALPKTRFARERWSGTLIGNHGFGEAYDYARADELIGDGTLDLIAVGRDFLANPDLPERLRTGAELNTPDEDTFYSRGPKGYTDYPTLAQVAQG
ncbi:alkene reductase [Patulibacter sp. NPDC049589]|uniref:alkene reductase n=1 Tax=Patulibacter sp. NPDC049589 TaxID=3154731 RepID=UPI00343A90E5